MNNKWNNAPPVHQSNIVISNLLCKLKENNILHPARETTHIPQVIPLHYCQTATNSKAASNDNSNINLLYMEELCLPMQALFNWKVSLLTNNYTRFGEFCFYNPYHIGKIERKCKTHISKNNIFILFHQPNEVSRDTKDIALCVNSGCLNGEKGLFSCH